MVDKVSRSSVRMGWIKGFVVFEHSEGNVQQFAHGCADDDAFGFPIRAEALSKLANHQVVFNRHQSWHVERFAQRAVPHFGKPAFFMHGFARLMPPRAQASVRSRLARAKFWPNCPT